MDKRLVGKWYKEEQGETLNIFGEIPLRMKISFSSSGHYNFEPNCVYEKDGYLCFELNDEKYRRVYHIKFMDDHLEGYYTQFGQNTSIYYSLVSNRPDDEQYQFLPSEVYIPGTEDKRIDVLKKYALYNRAHHGSYETEYVLGGEIPPVLERYGFSEYVKNTDAESDEIVFKILDFVCDHFGHNGTGGLPLGRKMEDIIEFC